MMMQLNLTSTIGAHEPQCMKKPLSILPSNESASNFFVVKVRINFIAFDVLSQKMSFNQY